MSNGGAHCDEHNFRGGPGSHCPFPHLSTARTGEQAPEPTNTPAAPPSGEGPYKTGDKITILVGDWLDDFAPRTNPWVVKLRTDGEVGIAIAAFAAGQATQSPRSERIEVAAKAYRSVAESAIEMLGGWDLTDEAPAEQHDAMSDYMRHRQILAAALEQENT